MTAQELYAIDLPEKTASYSPVSHQQVIESVTERLDKCNLTIAKADYSASTDGMVMRGVFQINADNPIFTYQIGFQNSYNKTLPVAFVGGTTVMVCSNGMVTGDIKFVRRHTGEVAKELDGKIEQVVGNLSDELETANRQSQIMSSIELNTRTISELCGRFFMEQEIITSSQLNIIKMELRNPTFQDFSEPTLWSLYNHTTYALKKTHPYMYLRQHEALHKFITREFDLDLQSLPTVPV